MTIQLRVCQDNPLYIIEGPQVVISEKDYISLNDFSFANSAYSDEIPRTLCGISSGHHTIRLGVSSPRRVS